MTTIRLFYDLNKKKTYLPTKICKLKQKIVKLLLSVDFYYFGIDNELNIS